MQVKRFVLNPLSVNCYLIFEAGQALIVDPGEAAPEVLDFIESQELEILAIINTHGHADHTAGNAWFAEKTKAPLWIHQEDAPYLTDPNLHLGTYLRQELASKPADRFLQEGDTCPVGTTDFQILHTPGHSPGSICLYRPGLLISGDTLFRSSVGRWDLPGGDYGSLQKSLARLARLPGSTKVYPGHGEFTTIAEEIKGNPFM